jgi:hypothetical protein
MGEARAQAKGKFPSLKNSLGDNHLNYSYKQSHNHECHNQMDYGVYRQGLHAFLVDRTSPACPCPIPITTQIIPCQ